MKSIAEIMEEAISRNTEYISKPMSNKEFMERIANNENKQCGTENLIDGYDCQLCLNRGYFSRVRDYDGMCENYMEVCSCMRVRRSIRALKNSGLANVVEDFTFEKFEATEPFQEYMLTRAKSFLENPESKWLAFLGASGSGKTHLCSAVAIELIKQGKDVKYMLWKDDSRKIKNNNFDGDGLLLDYYKNVEVLYIDDLFKTGKSEGQLQKVTAGDINIAFEILNSRVVQKKTTIISSEISIDELFDIDEAVAGRIKQMCREYCVNISKGKGKNYRKRDFV